ncbi:hypothetical protein RHMOL_Rhmol10G0254000 [Rhododendron molle]|uniref:Uncharacterized protein n=1 Tax=Rhododendron molle TaxID=49168 RepID=A0ACC0M7V7_RHOML|nr:hypothetical protein RHMOL_Rhmol10G0254000 [Rhododendron molle]
MVKPTAVFIIFLMILLHTSGEIPPASRVVRTRRRVIGECGNVQSCITRCQSAFPGVPGLPLTVGGCTPVTPSVCFCIYSFYVNVPPAAPVRVHP